jgi:Sulfotransferase family
VVNNSPFFIVGAGRSGTTLLRLMLVGHSRIDIPPETWWIEPLVHRLPLTEPLTRSQAASAVAIMTGDYRWPDMDIAPQQLQEWVDALDRPKLVDVINLVYAYHLRRSGKPRFGDKTPKYCQIVPELLKLYPDASFIHLIRDGRDVAISWIELGWDRYYQPDFEWKCATRRMQSYAGGLRDRILDVRYEQLVARPEAELRRICQFLGEEFEPDMLHPDQRTNLVPERERGIHQRLKQPIRQDSTAVWRRKLRGWECFAMEACLYRDLHRLGYRLRFAGTPWRPALAATGSILGLSAPLLRRVIPRLQRHRLLPRSIYV